MGIYGMHKKLNTPIRKVCIPLIKIKPLLPGFFLLDVTVRYFFNNGYFISVNNGIILVFILLYVL